MSELKLKNKITKINSYSILLVVLIFSFLSFFSVYFVLRNSYKQEIKIIKNEYISSQKTIIKNQVNNFIDFIKHTKKILKQEQFKILARKINTLTHILEISNPKKFTQILSIPEIINNPMKVGLSDIKGNLIFTTAKDFSIKKRLKLIDIGFNKIISHKTSQGLKYSYILKFQNKIDHKYYILGGAIYEKFIDQRVKMVVLDRIKSIKFGAKNNGYLSIAEILNYKGGNAFAKVVALPIKPKWVGKLLNEDKKDAKGKMYRKEYLKIANSTGEGYVSYWFFKKKTKKLRPKLSYIKLYKPYNWLIFTSIYLDDINAVIAKKEETLKKEIRQIFILYTIFSITFLIIAYIVSKYENKVLNKIIEKYEAKINLKNEELYNINKHLETEVKIKTEELLENLLKDTLTNLPNREKLLLDIAEKKQFIAILNIDSFKEINDFYGLKIGDLVLRKLASILKYSVSEKSYKLSGDEFGILDDSIEELNNKINNLFFILSKTSIKINEENININISCGIGNSITNADMALKYAKKHKSQKIVIFNENLNIVKEYENNLKWKNIIHSAIKQNNILTFIQPIVNNKTNLIDKYECLVRLKHKDKIYSPYFFLDISKQTSQYYEIQKIMVLQSFEKFHKLNYKFSINLSTIDLTNHSFKEFLLEQIDKYQVQNKLIIELLEDENLLEKNILSFLKLLKEKNIDIAIDDFGSGYSNFAYLIKDLPVSILKIDGSLVKNIATNENDYKLFKSIIEMAKNFDFEIVAEFVENKEILDVLKELEVDYSQGYHFSAPFNITELQA